ncbi:MAG: inner membrane CreD family protein [Thiolinea sp.]
MLVRDQRGIAQPPQLKWEQRTLAFKPGGHLANATSGKHVCAPAGTADQPFQQLPFAFTLELRADAVMNFAPLSENSANHFTWPHPKFSGEAAAENRDINQQALQPSGGPPRFPTMSALPWMPVMTAIVPPCWNGRSALSCCSRWMVSAVRAQRQICPAIYCADFCGAGVV